jgi:hypothetical protein
LTRFAGEGIFKTVDFDLLGSAALLCNPVTPKRSRSPGASALSSARFGAGPEAEGENDIRTLQDVFSERKKVIENPGWRV